MNHLPVLIEDLALILSVAAFISLIFKRLKQPVVLGYLIAGLLVGPYFRLFPTIVDHNSVETWAQIGVVFLLFSLGLDFSFKKLLRVGAPAAITGVIELSCMYILGYTIGKLLSFSFMNCLFLGAVISVSSTTIIYKAFEEMGLKNKKFTKLVMGILVIEDLLAVLMMVLLSSLAGSHQFNGMQLLFSFLKLIFVLCLWFVLGIYLLPTFFRKVSTSLSSEILLLISIGLCLLMAVLSSSLGFSAALGAFVSGSLLSETVQSGRIQKQVSPVKDLFGAVFFISVGMLLDPAMLMANWKFILILLFSVLLGKLVFVTLGALISGRTLEQSVKAASSMTQIGEFSFIIATMGISYKATSSFLYPASVGVSVITTFMTPYMIRLSPSILGVLNRKLPHRWLEIIENYSGSSQLIDSDNNWRLLLHRYVQLLLANGVVAFSIILLSTHILRPIADHFLGEGFWGHLLVAFVTLLLMLPFIWGLAGKKIKNITSYTELWLDKKYNRGPLVSLEIFRVVIAVLLVGVMLKQLFPMKIAFAGSMGILIVLISIFSRKLQLFYQRIEHRFLFNLHGIPEMNEKEHPLLSPWDAHIAIFNIAPEAPFLAVPLRQLSWREQYGINIAFIERGSSIFYAPDKDCVLYPFDRIGVIGTDEQLESFTKVVSMPESSLEEPENNIELQKLLVNEYNKLSGKTIRNSGIREKTRGLVVGIERDGNRLLNPSSDTVFKWGDILWIVGDIHLIGALRGKKGA